MLRSEAIYINYRSHSNLNDLEPTIRRILFVMANLMMEQLGHAERFAANKRFQGITPRQLRAMETTDAEEVRREECAVMEGDDDAADADDSALPLPLLAEDCDADEEDAADAEEDDSEEVYNDDTDDDADDADEKAAVRDEHLAALHRLQKRHVAHGQAVTVRVVAVNGHRVDVSLRASRVAAEKIGQQTKADAMPAVGAVVAAYIHNVSNKGCFVRLSQTLKGRSLIKDLADTFVESPEDAFPTGRLVACRVQSVDMLKGHVSVVLKESVVHAAVANKKA
eukprot:gene34662-44443_t